MENFKNNIEKPKQTMKDGIETRALFIKHISTADWQLLNTLISRHSLKTVARGIRFAIRKAEELTR